MTLAPLLAVARDDLDVVVGAVPDMWRHLYDPDWQPDSGRAATGKRSRPPADLDRLPVRRTWHQVVDEIARAHWCLGRNTDVPVHWTHQPGSFRFVTDVDLAGATKMLALLLDWLDRQDLDSAGRRAVEEACGHIGAARGHVEDLWPPRRRQPQKLPLCLHCGKEPPERQRSDTEATRKWCSNCRRGHQPDRLSCQVCGLGAA